MKNDVPWCPGVGKAPTELQRGPFRCAGFVWPSRGRCAECGRGNLSVSNKTGLMLPHGWSPKERSRRQVWVES